MTTIRSTATVLKKDKGHFVAGVDEHSITAQPASTQRGAIKKLKQAVLLRLRKAAETGTLTKLLDDAGYPGSLIRLHEISLQCHIYDGVPVTLPVPHRLSILNQSRRKATGDERRSHV